MVMIAKLREGKRPCQKTAYPDPSTHRQPAWRLVQDAIKAVPAVRYALGIGGIAALVALIGGLGVDYRVALFGTLITLGLSFVLVLFARMSEFAGAAFYLPIMVATWSFLVLTIASSVGLATSFFFQWPLDFREIVNHRMIANSKGPVFENPQLDGRKIDGCIRSPQFPQFANLQCIEFRPKDDRGCLLQGSWVPNGSQLRTC